MKRIVIIGAGPTGLVTAHSLSEKTNYDVQVFDANSFVGGLVGSGSIDRMVYDYGPHIFHSGHEDITNFWRDNFGDLLLEKEFFYKIIRTAKCMTILYHGNRLKNFRTK